MPSLLDAIETKYGEGDDIEAPIGIYVPRIGARKSIPRLLILNDCDVDSAGDESLLEKTCAGVLEIDLAHNQLTHWSEISKILQYTPCVSFLNLSFNGLSKPLKLACPENPFPFPLLPRLTVLILIGTKVTWDSVWIFLRQAGGLQELHLSLNDFETVDTSGSRGASVRKFNVNNPPDEEDEEEQENPNGNDSGNGSSSEDDDGFSFPNIRKIMFDGNPISGWNEIFKLGICFPSMRHLGLADCPISSVPEEASQCFENLQSISVTNTLIGDLTDIDRLAKFPSLSELRIQGVPLLSDLTAHERRQLLIALLPNIKKLNGGAPISNVEREDAERAFIRRFAQDANPPKRFSELRSVHGNLLPLVEVHLKPTTRVKLKIVSGDISAERHVNLYQTTNDLKVHLEPVVKIPKGRMRLFYIDSEMRGVFGREEMKFPQKQLYSYNMQDGDEIHIEPKTPISKPH